MNTGKFLLIALAVVAFTSYATAQKTPYYTKVGNIYTLKQGMSMDQIDKALGIEPYDIYTNYEQGLKVLQYKYKLQYQKVSTKLVGREESLTGGIVYFKDENDLFVVLSQADNKLLYYITSDGRLSADQIINKSNSLAMIENSPENFLKTSKKEKTLSFTKKNEPDIYTVTSINGEYMSEIANKLGLTVDDLKLKYYPGNETKKKIEMMKNDEIKAKRKTKFEY